MAKIFASAYRQLTPVEKRYVDDYVQTLERQADREQERLSNYLHLAIADDVYTASGGMLDRPMVIAAITERVNEITSATELSPNRIIKEYITIAFSNMSDYLTVDSYGNPEFDLTKCTPEQLAAIKKINFERNSMGAEKLTFELYDKQKAMDMLAKYVGLIEPDNEHWRSNNARPTIDALATVAQAADAYAAILGD
jgi:hypothetical protein